jgi:tRNA G18 (ribose-2'-O)-methylase SpoU
MISTAPKRDIIVVLPDIRSTHNTGSFFRTGDAVGVSKIILTGITAPPPHPHLVKVSLGAEDTVPWEYIEHTAEALRALQAQGYSIVVVEQTEASTDFRAATYPAKVAIVFGNEVGGVPKEICDAADMVVELPMHGEKESLNVSVAGGIILYHVAHA